MPELLPLRHGRMVRSAFTFYRGSALTMASDLASTPTTRVCVQCCGDAHLATSADSLSLSKTPKCLSRRELSFFHNSLLRCSFL